MKNTFDMQSQIQIMTHFSNHFEGSEKLYNKFEKEVKNRILEINFIQIVKTLKLFYNVKKGDKLFIKELLERSNHMIDPESFDCILYL